MDLNSTLQTEDRLESLYGNLFRNRFKSNQN